MAWNRSSLAQRLFGSFALGDVGTGYQYAQRPALGIAMQHPYAGDHDLTAVPLAVY
jgi:hypothetical protein